MPKGHYDRTNCKQRGKRSAISFYENFWSKKRVEQNAQINDIAELLGIKGATMSAYFTGQIVPPEEVIKALCELFNVDVVEGTREFINAHKAYDAKHKRELKFSARTIKIIEGKKKEDEQNSLSTEPTPIEKVAEEIRKSQDKIFGAVYGKVSYREYTDLMEQVILDEGDFDLAKWLYNRVDYETFNSIIKSLEE